MLHAELEVSFELRGTADAMRAALGAASITTWSPLGGDKVQAVVRLPNQGEVDALIDRLRANGVSILELKPNSLSLEDAFLKLLSTTVS